MWIDKTYYFILILLYFSYFLSFIFYKNEKWRENINEYIELIHTTLQIFIAITLILITNPIYEIKTSNLVLKRIAFSSAITILLSFGLSGLLKYFQKLKRKTETVVKNTPKIMNDVPNYMKIHNFLERK